MNSIKAIIFDLDGTLYESRHFPLRLILADPLHICTLAAERKCRKQLRGRQFASAQEYYRELFLLMGEGSPEKAGRCRKWFFDRYLPAQIRIIRESFGPRKDVKALMEKLSADGYKVAVLSDYGAVDEKLAACGLSSGMFFTVAESAELGSLKPDRNVFLNICSRMGVEPSEALMVGDKVSTDGGAIDAGLQFIHIIDNEKDRGKSGPQYTDRLWSEFLSMFM